MERCARNSTDAWGGLSSQCLNAKSEPPCAYFQINDTYVSVIKLDKKAEAPKRHDVKDVQHKVVHATPSRTPTRLTSTRIDELQERLTNIINDEIADKMLETQSQMADLKGAVNALDHGSKKQQAAVLEIKRIKTNVRPVSVSCNSQCNKPSMMGTRPSCRRCIRFSNSFANRLKPDSLPLNPRWMRLICKRAKTSTS